MLWDNYPRTFQESNMPQTAQEHLKRCIERAMMRRNAGRTPLAVEGFMEELREHPGTASIASHGATPALLLGTAHDPKKFREALESLKVIP